MTYLLYGDCCSGIDTGIDPSLPVIHEVQLSVSSPRRPSALSRTSTVSTGNEIVLAGIHRNFSTDIVFIGVADAGGTTFALSNRNGCIG